MIKVPIETRRDYEMFVKNKVAELIISNKQKAIVRKLVMEGFDDGMSFQANSGGYVDIRED